MLVEASFGKAEALKAVCILGIFGRAIRRIGRVCIFYAAGNCVSSLLKQKDALEVTRQKAQGTRRAVEREGFSRETSKDGRKRRRH